MFTESRAERYSGFLHVSVQTAICRVERSMLANSHSEVQGGLAMVFGGSTVYFENSTIVNASAGSAGVCVLPLYYS
eukprot:7386602-Prymnesium_polylepis.1